jgi:vancomycin resistance protein YoaR
MKLMKSWLKWLKDKSKLINFKKTKKKSESSQKKLKISPKYLIFGGVGLILLCLIAFASYSFAYDHKNYLHVYVGDIDLGGKSKEATVTILNDNSQKFINSEITLKNPDTDKTYSLDPVEIGCTFNVEKTADEIWQYGRDNQGVINNFYNQFLSLFVKKRFPLAFALNQTGLDQKVKVIADELDQPEKDYALVYNNGVFELATERAPGARIDQKKIKDDIRNRFSTLSLKEIDFSISKYDPQITLENANKTLKDANTIIDGGELVLKDSGQNYTIDKETIVGFIKSSSDGQELALVFNEDRMHKYLETIAKSINIDSGNAKLRMENGKVTVFNQATIGKTLKVEETISEIKNALLARINGISKSANLVIDTKIPQITETGISNLGIKELVGSATTSFKGSPANRIHNITIGANGINGVLLKPGEEFSTLGHLGNIDATGGYLEELVIREDRTVPEFGGGLCQVSTTLFRMAINAGMKITERSNHKYRVGYFEPPIGMDATIYDPAPDFKFINNYGSYVLIQSKVEGNTLTFEVYGTKDGRKIEISTPVAYDYTTPGDPVMIETDTLAPGEKKQIEKAHNGASAKFDYKVTTTSGEILQQKTFISKYIPWPEKWLVGKAAPVAETPPASPPAPSCTDASQNGDETGVDCGGSCPTACPTT